MTSSVAKKPRRDGILPDDFVPLRRRLLAWYRRHRRDLPWRRSRDPYRVWISEIMLQQTQVATVVPYYERFLASFPDVAALATADEHDVLRHWEGLGYYRRARQLHRAARQIVERHEGRFPSTRPHVEQLAGIGRYTAGAVLSIALDAPEPILEANTARLHSRLLAVDGDLTTRSAQSSCGNSLRGTAPAPRGRGPESGPDGSGGAGLHAQRAALRRVSAGRVVPGPGTEACKPPFRARRKNPRSKQFAKRRPLSGVARRF